MRQLTAYASYLDNLGNPLVGRARFCNMDGTPAVVYSLDNATQNFVQIGSTVYTNSSGQLVPQVFLDDHDYIVVFDKYIGDGTMAEDDDAESWAEQGSAVDKYNTVRIELDGDTVRTVNTIADLRDTEPVIADGETTEVVVLLGYNTLGDKEPIYYKWSAGNTDQDNGGSTIKVSSIASGRWVFVECPQRLDVKHFGAFPLQDSVEDQTQRYAIQNACQYAHAQNKGIYFTGNDTAVYYDISGLQLYDVSSDQAARLFGVDSTAAEIIGIESLHCGGSTHGTIELISDTVRSSWEADYGYCILSPTERLVIDSTLRTGNRSWDGIKVDFETDGGDYIVLDDCIITSNNAITSGITIKNCELRTSWFADDYLWSNLISIDNLILLQNCKDADTYIKLKNKQSEADYGDLGEQELHAAEFLPDALVENCSGSATMTGALELHNATLTLTVIGAPADIVGANVWLTMASAAAFDGVTLFTGSVSGATVTAIGDVQMNDVTLNSELNIQGGSFTAYGCTFNGDIAHVGSPVVEEILYCKFASTLEIRGGEADSVVNARWENNVGEIVTPIVFDRSNLDADDRVHDYVYQGNTGTFKMATEESIAVKVEGTYTAGTPGTIGVAGPVHGPHQGLAARAEPGGDASGKYLCHVGLFSVGTTHVRKRVKFTPSPVYNAPSDNAMILAGGTATVSTDDLSANSLPSLAFDNGFSWKLRNLFVPGFVSIGNDLSIKIAFEGDQ